MKFVLESYLHSSLETVQVWLSFVPLSRWKLFSSFSLSFSYSTIHWFPRKFVTTDFSDYQVDSSALLSASSNIESFMSCLI